MFKIRKMILIVSAAAALTFSGSICAFAEEIEAADQTQTEAVAETTSPVIYSGAARAAKAAEAAEVSAAISEEDSAVDSAEAEAAEAAEADSSTTHNYGFISLGTFKTTAYCPCASCSEGWGRHTSTGAIAQSNHTIAVDPRVIPYGSKVMINGTVYTAEDRGGGVKGNHIDIFYDTHAQTRQYGSRNTEVFLFT